MKWRLMRRSTNVIDLEKKGKGKRMTNKRTPPDWYRILKTATRREKKGLSPFTGRNVEAVKDWTTCAVGEAHKKAPKVVAVFSSAWAPRWAPRDRDLAQYGISFLYAVNEGRVEDAKRVYVNIQTRITELQLEKAFGL